MRANSKPGTVLVMYTIILYSFWSLLELYLKTKIGIDEFTKEVYSLACTGNTDSF